MAWYNFWQNNDSINEETKQFKNKGENLSDKFIDRTSGEGVEEAIENYGVTSLSSFNTFYKDFINKRYKNEVDKIKKYREMAQMPEISDVIEDAVNEMITEDDEGGTVSLDIKNADMEKNKNIVNTLTDEFNTLFYNKIEINKIFDQMASNYFIDGRLYFEKIIDTSKSKNGIIGIKILPSETMDFVYDKRTGKPTAFYQYLSSKPSRPKSFEDAINDPNVIAFFPEQIGFLSYGVYGSSRNDIKGFLEKAKIPYNQLKLLETSVIIYRIVRAPERFVFRIDTGNMPKSKAMRYVEKIKDKMTKRQTYDALTGRISNETNVMGILENFFLPQCLRMNTEIPLLDGRILELGDIIEEYNDGKKNYTYSVDQDTGKVIKGEIEWAGITRKNADLIRVYLDNGNHIDVTPDHKFVMRDGKEIMAQNLKYGDSLMPFYTKTEKINNNTNDYHQFYDLKDNKWEYSHRKFGPKPKRGYAIHHKDFNRFNNNPENLESIEIQEHIKLHYKSNKERNSHIPLLKALNKPENREKQRVAARKSMIERFKDPEVRKNYSDMMKERWNNQRCLFLENVRKPKSERHKNSLSKSIKNKWDNDIEYREKCSIASKKRWENKEFASYMSKVQSCVVDERCEYYLVYELIKNNYPNFDNMLKSLSNNIEFMNHWKNINQNIKSVKKDELGKTSFYKIIRFMGFNSYTELKKNIIVNHKVIKVEKLNIKEDTGCLTIKDPGKNHNFAVSCGVFIKNSADGRGSQIDSIGGSSAGFTELDDIYYFARKLYRALKYPMSRVTAMQEKQEGEILFGGRAVGEISRDEIKWSKFLEKQQNKFADILEDLFLLHLDFKGLKAEYELTKNDIDIVMNPPNDYKEQMKQNFYETRFNNYQMLADRPEFSKYYLMKEFLKMSDEEIERNKDGKKKDKELGFEQEEGGMF